MINKTKEELIDLVKYYKSEMQQLQMLVISKNREITSLKKEITKLEKELKNAINNK